MLNGLAVAIALYSEVGYRRISELVYNYASRPSYDCGRVVASIPREANICFNCQSAPSAAAELLVCSICRRNAFSEGSLSLIAHRHTNTLASWKLVFGRFG